MKKIIMILCWLLPTIVHAQKNEEVVFKDFSNWQQVLAKAKTEHKNIFVDAYATWCGPCKKMDADVYTDPKVVEFVNSNFIAVKVQFDQTDKDSEGTKHWYTDAKYLMDTYHIEAFPTFLFISPNGELLQKDMGYQNPSDFLTILNNAINPQDNYAGQVNQFKKGKITRKQLLVLIIKTKDYHNDSLALEMAKFYKKSFIDQSQSNKIINAELPAFIVNFHELLSIHDPIVQFMYHKPALADSMMELPGYSRRVVDNLIAKDAINPIIKPNGKYTSTLPHWDALEKQVAKSYDPITAKRLLINAKIGWYSAVKDWPNIIKYNIEKLDDQGLDTVGLAASALNNLSYNIIFKFSNDPYALNKAIGYMEVLLKNQPKNVHWLDTYANLLYKVGRKKEAIKHETVALDFAKETNKDEISIYEERIKKMQDNIPTWQ
ncbi:thioredoxin family protein [Chitinophaga oryziterrae]|nr:thioredoxin family protein [Chitinophaga oryziterrae]